MAFCVPPLTLKLDSIRQDSCLQNDVSRTVLDFQSALCVVLISTVQWINSPVVSDNFCHEIPVTISDWGCQQGTLVAPLDSYSRVFEKWKYVRYAIRRHY